MRDLLKDLAWALAVAAVVSGVIIAMVIGSPKPPSAPPAVFTPTPQATAPAAAHGTSCSLLLSTRLRECAP